MENHNSKWLDSSEKQYNGLRPKDRRALDECYMRALGSGCVFVMIYDPKERLFFVKFQAPEDQPEGTLGEGLASELDVACSDAMSQMVQRMSLLGINRFDYEMKSNEVIVAPV